MEHECTGDSVVRILRQIIRALDLQSKKLTKNYGLTGPQLIILKEIKKSADRPISSIARSVSLSQATVTSILDRLEHQGYAMRKRSETDKRKVNLCLTEKAEAVLETNPPLLQENFSRKFDHLADWEKSMILASLQRLAEIMEAERIPASSIPEHSIF
jgi:DNA-binding MarR family transcriptional regulator